ncbi:MAG: aminotransferase class V-fold PLP-dependent enzyme [Rhodothermales bacterium]|nr:aminotransferase class V-fold PLP-dependent enzyme [Rhodothermales bacterium]
MLDCQSDHFNLPVGSHYINCAYMSPMPKAVEEAGVAAIRSKRDPSRIKPEDFFETSDLVRRAFAGIVDCDRPDRVSLIPAVSYGIATAARNIDLGPGDAIVLLHEQFPSNVYTWRRRAAETDAELRIVHPPPDGADRAADWNERILDAIRRDTAVVSIPIVHWADGTRFDLERISSRAKDVGAALIVDGTQSIGALPFSFDSVRPDVLVCAGYKWLFGPYSTALACWGDRFLDGVPIEENWITRRNADDFAGLVDYEDAYEPGAVRFDVGERSNFVLLPMLLEALNLVSSWRPDAIQSYCRDLMRPALDRISALGYRVGPPAARGSHLFGIRMPESIGVDALRTELTRRSVSVSVRGDAVRVAPNVYNGPEDVEALLDALEAAVVA